MPIFQWEHWVAAPQHLQTCLSLNSLTSASARGEVQVPFKTFHLETVKQHNSGRTAFAPANCKGWSPTQTILWFYIQSTAISHSQYALERVNPNLSFTSGFPKHYFSPLYFSSHPVLFQIWRIRIAATSTASLSAGWTPLPSANYCNAGSLQTLHHPFLSPSTFPSFKFQALIASSVFK